MKDFNWNSDKDISQLITGKNIEKCEILDEGMDTFLQFIFTDSTILKIRYDYIYDWDVIE